MRMAAQTAPIEGGAVHRPRQVGWIDDVKQDLLAFLLGKHDDQIDAFSLAPRRAFAPPPPTADFFRSD